MTDNTQNLDEQISDILAAIYLAGTENGLGRQLTDPAEIMHRKEAFINANPASTEAKRAIIDWHNKQVEEVLGRLGGNKETLYWWTGGEYEKTTAVDMRAIAAERAKLKEVK